MASKVDAMPEPGRGNKRYPWEQWLNGDVWELVEGKDYNFPNTIRAAAKAAAINRGLSVKVMLRGDKTYIQAVRVSGE